MIERCTLTLPAVGRLAELAPGWDRTAILIWPSALQAQLFGDGVSYQYDAVKEVGEVKSSDITDQQRASMLWILQHAASYQVRPAMRHLLRIANFCSDEHLWSRVLEVFSSRLEWGDIKMVMDSVRTLGKPGFLSST